MKKKKPQQTLKAYNLPS